MFAWVTSKGKVKEEPNSSQEATSELIFTFSNNQYLSESRSILDFKANIKSIKAIK